MKYRRFILQSLCYHWRTHLGVVLGSAVAAAVLTGALLVGESVEHTLSDMVSARLGSTGAALSGGRRFFRTDLAGELSKKLGADVAPVLQLEGLAVEPEGDRRCNRVEVLGVDGRFFAIGGCPDPLGEGENLVVLNEALAERLKAGPGDEILLRVAKPGQLPGEAPLSLDDDASVAPRLIVKAVACKEGFGNFNLRADQLAPFNAFVPLERLGEWIERPGRANLLLAGEGGSGSIDAAQANEALDRVWRLADAGLELRTLEGQGVLELRSERIFLERPAAAAAAGIDPSALGVFSYFVNRIEKDGRRTPYSMVAALGPLEEAGGGYPGDALPPPSGKSPSWTGDIVPPDLKKDEVLLTEWLAKDLDAGPGDAVRMRYYVMKQGRRLEERASEFRVRGVLPMAGPVLDPTLMPPFPGLSGKDNCREWEPGIDIDLSMIRPEDEAYWAEFRGAPKAFIALEAGRELWGNRFGDLTAVRIPLKDGGSRLRVEESLRRELSPPAMGLLFTDVRGQALRASSQAMDFGQLFLGLSFFLIAGALILTGLLFSLGIEQRREESGTLLALGFSRGAVRRLALAEGLILAAAGAGLGIAGSCLYTPLILYGLATVWKDAVAGSAVGFHLNGWTLLIGGSAGMLMALVTMAVMLWRQGRRRIRELLDESGGSSGANRIAAQGNGRTGWVLAAAAFTGAVLLIGVPSFTGRGTGAGVFFGAGSLLLIAAMGVVHGLLCRWAGISKALKRSLAGLAVQNAASRRGRSLGVAGMLACGSFLVFAVGANRSFTRPDDLERSSGTGGFALVGESSLPVLQDLNDPEGRKGLGLEEEAFEGAGVVSVRVRDGDDASCLNLNRAQTPRLLGVEPKDLDDRGAFSFADTLDGEDEAPWLLLNGGHKGNQVPGIADHDTILWALGKKLGDTIDYVDERGRTFSVRLVGALKSSILQGTILISKEVFIHHFPSEEGYRMFLVDAPLERRSRIAEALRRAGMNKGLEVEDTRKRLERFYAVQNTYLSIFQILGALGMLLGSAGLAFLLLRNVLERRSELAMLRAVGFTRGLIVRLLIYEHGWLLGLGLAAGVTAAGVAVWPALRAGGSEVPYISLGITLAALAAGGVAWIWIAAKAAVRGELIEALRDE